MPKYIPPTTDRMIRVPCSKLLVLLLKFVDSHHSTGDSSSLQYYFRFQTGCKKHLNIMPILNKDHVVSRTSSLAGKSCLLVTNCFTVLTFFLSTNKTCCSHILTCILLSRNISLQKAQFANSVSPAQCVYVVKTMKDNMGDKTPVSVTGDFLET